MKRVNNSCWLMVEQLEPRCLMAAGLVNVEPQSSVRAEFWRSGPHELIGRLGASELRELGYTTTRSQPVALAQEFHSSRLTMTQHQPPNERPHPRLAPPPAVAPLDPRGIAADRLVIPMSPPHAATYPATPSLAITVGTIAPLQRAATVISDERLVIRLVSVNPSVVFVASAPIPVQTTVDLVRIAGGVGQSAVTGRSSTNDAASMSQVFNAPLPTAQAASESEDLNAGDDIGSTQMESEPLSQADVAAERRSRAWTPSYDRKPLPRSLLAPATPWELSENTLHDLSELFAFQGDEWGPATTTKPWDNRAVDDAIANWFSGPGGLISFEQAMPEFPRLDVEHDVVQVRLNASLGLHRALEVSEENYREFAVLNHDGASARMRVAILNALKNPLGSDAATDAQTTAGRLNSIVAASVATVFAGIVLMIHRRNKTTDTFTAD